MNESMIVPEFIQEAFARFENNPITVQVDGGESGLPEAALETKRKARAFARERIAPIARQIDEQNETPDDLWKALGDEGFFALAIPKEHGGRGSILETCVAVEEISRVSASVGLLVSVGLLGPTALILAGSEDQQRTWLPIMAKGGFSSFCLTEPVAGTDAAGVQTRVEQDADGYVLNGLKQYITGAGKSDVYTVFARSGEGRYEMTAILMPADSAGFTVDGLHPFAGIHGVPVGQLRFEDVRLPDEAVVGEPGRGFQLALATLDRARPAIAAQALGLAQGALDAAFSYLAHRQQFGKPLLDQDVIQHRLSRHAAAIAAARQLTYHAGALADANDPALNATASMSKLFCSDLAMQVVTDAMQFWGGAGYVQGSPVERMYRDAKIIQIYEGTNEIQEMVIARALLNEYKRQTGEG